MTLDDRTGGTQIRVLVFADSHLGFDLPLRPRVKRRRRGHDFLANHERALEPALAGKVDLVVHGGDVFDRPRVPASLVRQAFAGLLRVADRGVPVFVVPGNHERSRIPHAHLARHELVHVFNEPGTRTLEVRGTAVALGGFPFRRRDVRTAFTDLVRETGALSSEARIRLLCMHHTVEGATVGPGDFTFRWGPDVIRGAQVPDGFAGVLSGHIHRHQVLTSDLKGRALRAPVFYPGSVERTSIAEKDEEKGYLLLRFGPGGEGGRLLDYEFVGLPARPIIVRELPAGAARDGPGAVGRWIRRAIHESPANAVLRLRVSHALGPDALELFRAATIRRLAPDSMNVRVVFANGSRSRTRRPRSRRERGVPEWETGQIALPIE